MTLFDKRFVHFMWDDELEEKECFVADNINTLIERIKKAASIYKVHRSRDKTMPFERDNDLVRYRFAYYDPNYEVKKAFNEGKKVQILLAGGVDWRDVEDEVALERYIETGRQFRVKPEEKKWIVYLARTRLKDKDCYLTACREDNWGTAQKSFGAKTTKLFIGTHDEVIEWLKACEKFTEVIKAWEDGKQIQLKNGLNNWFNINKPDWLLESEYRVKPDCHCEEKTFRPFKDCDELVEFWSKNYQTGFRPANTKPLIWVRLKDDERERFIVAFGTNFVEIGNKTKAVTLQHLFEQYEFLDDKPCGMEVKE